MAKKTVADLKILREELAGQTTTSPPVIDQRALERLGTLSGATFALDDLMAEGVNEP